MVKVGLIIADIDEYKPLRRILKQTDAKEIKLCNKEAHQFTVTAKSGDISVTSVLCGIGKVNAAMAAAALCEQGAQVILNCGLSGGISGVRRNDFCIPERFLEYDFDMTCIGYLPCQKPGQVDYIFSADNELSALLKKAVGDAVGGTAATGDRFVQSDELRLELEQNFGATSCDTETAAIAAVCFDYGVKFASLRQISDDAGDAAVLTYRELNVRGEDTLVNAVLAVIAEL